MKDWIYMENPFTNYTNITPGVIISKEINNQGKHLFSFDKTFPVALNLYSFKHNFRLTPNYHDYLEITYVLEGKGLLNVENKKYIFSKDDLIILGLHELHTFSKYHDQGFINASLLFMPETIYKPGGNEFDFEYLGPFFYRNDKFNHIIHPGKINNRKIVQYLKNVFILLRDKNINYKLEVKSYLIKILLMIIKHHNKINLKPNKSYYKKIEDINRLHNLIAFVQKEYVRNIMLKEAAETTNMSLHYFCKFFKRVMGITFSKYLLNIRIDMAKELLITEKTSVTNIAYKVGFESLSYFFRKFKELTGMSPREFKYKLKRHRPKISLQIK